MNKLFAVLFAFFPTIWGLSAATQKVARSCNYDPVLGTPLFSVASGPFYSPHKYIVWYIELKKYIPHIISSGTPYVFGGIVVTALILYFLAPKKRPDSHGSARWAEYKDILKMDLISGSGVVVGLYDSGMKKAFTNILRSLENIKKEKYAYAEMDFDAKRGKKLDALREKIQKLQYKLDNTNPGSEAFENLSKQLTKIVKTIENMPGYSPAGTFKDKLTVYPWVMLYDLFFKFYVTLGHFYLRDNSNKHLAVIAPTRSGKGVGLIVPTLLGGWKESVIVNDIKSENWGITAGYRKTRMGHTVIKFEPTATDGSTARWNPLDEIPVGTPDEVSAAQNLAAIIADYEGKGKPDHWTANAANVIMAVLLHLKYAHYADPLKYPNPPNLYSVAAFMKANTDIQDNKATAKGFLDTLKDLINFQEEDVKRSTEIFEHVPEGGIKIREWNGAKGCYEHRLFTPEDLRHTYPDAQSLRVFPNVHPIIYQAFTEICSKAENEGASIISTANTALKEYLDPILAQNTAVSDFCVDDLMNYKKPVSLYLVTPPSDLLRLAPIFRLFFEMMVRHHAKSIGTYINGQAKTSYKHKCLFLMDEFSSLGNLQSFAATLSYIAGYGMKVFLINQGLPQINGIYGKDNQILMNCHLQIFYAPNDNDTAKYAEQLMGNETIITESTSDSGGFIPKKTYSHSEQARALMNSDEIKRLGEREIISASGFPPVLLDKVKYYENDYFRKRLIAAPIASDIIRNNPYPLRDELLRKNAETGYADSEFEFVYKEKE